MKQTIQFSLSASKGSRQRSRTRVHASASVPSGKVALETAMSTRVGTTRETICIIVVASLEMSTFNANVMCVRVSAFLNSGTDRRTESVKPKSPCRKNAIFLGEREYTVHQ